MSERKLTTDELIAIGNKRIIEIVGARLGVVNWPDWLRDNGWEVQTYHPAIRYGHKEYAPCLGSCKTDEEVFMRELKRAMFEPETLVK